MATVIQINSFLQGAFTRRTLIGFRNITYRILPIMVPFNRRATYHPESICSEKSLLLSFYLVLGYKLDQYSEILDKRIPELQQAHFLVLARKISVSRLVMEIHHSFQTDNGSQFSEGTFQQDEPASRMRSRKINFEHCNFYSI